MDLPKLSPPWYTLRNQLAYTIGKDPYVSISELIPIDNGDYRLDINVYYNINKAKSLRAIIPEEYTFGNITVKTHIYDLQNKEVPVERILEYTVKEIASIFYSALHFNKLFRGVILTKDFITSEDQNLLGQVTVIIAKDIIQFYNDDLTDLCGNYNEVASKVFEELLITEYPSNIKVSFSTKDNSCKIQNNLFCF